MESLLEIQKSTNYGWFKFLPTNRTVGTSTKVKDSVESFDMTPYVPIIVTSDGYIIDGQNRFDVCRQLGKPIHYVVYDGEYTPEQAMIALNTASKPWSLEEWFQHYVKNGVRNYVKMAQLLKEYSLGISNTIVLFSNGQTNSQSFKQGKLIDDSRNFIKAAEFIKTCGVPYNKYRPFVVAVLRFVEKYQAVPSKIAQLKRKVIGVPKFANAEQFLTAFENLVATRK